MGPGATPLVQVAYLVDDVVEAAGRAAAEHGAGPFTVLRHIELATVSHRGTPGTFDHSSAYGQWGGVMVELVQVHAAEPAGLHAAVAGRGPGLHHVATFVPDVAAEIERLEALGYPCVLDASTGGGTRFAFLDATARLGHLLEVYEPSEQLLGFYAHVARLAEGWDGTDPVRVVR